MDGLEGQSSKDKLPSGAAARIKALDRLTASNLRTSQVINRVSDIVRELVENSLDADATSIQVLLETFGKDKIEVRDNGHGLVPSDVKQIFQGGHTSKLQDTSNLSREKYLGFRGEALNAICAAGNVTVISKSSKESQATKYNFDCFGSIVSENKVARSTGTTVTVEKLFENIRVRRQRLDDKVAAKIELKEIEAYLKGTGVVNPKCHISLYHNTVLLLNKASVQTLEQALYAVLGHSVAKRLGKLGPNNVEIEHGETGNDRTIELYLPTKPVDMSAMSYTSNKMSMIFCNQKRVYIRKFEKLIHRYVVANVEKPQPANQRRFPVCALFIKVPPKEVDFNLNLDKAKVLLVHKDKIHDAIEDALIEFYGVDLRNSAAEKNHIDSNNQNCSVSSTNVDKSLAESKNVSIESKVETCKDATTPEIPRKSCVTPGLNTSSSSCAARQSTIQEFLQHIPSTSPAFTQSPMKLMNSEPVTVSFPVSKPNIDDQFVRNETKDKLKSKIPVRNVVANFEITIMDSQESPPESQAESDTGTSSSDLAKKRDEDAGRYLDWVQGRIKDKHGDIIESVVTVTGPPMTNNNRQESDRFHSALLAGSSKSKSITFNKDARSQLQASQLFHHNPLEPPSKRPRNEVLGNKSNILPPSVPVPAPVVPCGMLRMPNPKQVTLDCLANWAAPTSVFSQAASKSIVGVRIPCTPNRTKRPTDIPVSSERETFANCNENRVPKTALLWEQQERPNYKQQCLTTSQNATKNNINFSLIENFKVCKNFSKQLTPQLHKEIKGGFSDQLFFAQTYDSIGVFSPINMIKFFPNESRECWSPTSSCTSPDMEPLSLSVEDVSRMFQQFVTCSKINKTPVAEKIFHAISTLPHLTKSVSSSNEFL